MKFQIVSLAAMALFGSCSDQHGSRFKVANGLETKDGDFPSVMKVHSADSSTSTGTCTATAVSPNTLLTAAHCLTRSNGSLENKIWVKDESGREVIAKKESIYVHPRYNPLMATIQGSFDIAVVVFPETIAKNWVSVSREPGVIGDKITLVGFGITTVNGSDSGKKRYGTNIIKANEGKPDRSGSSYAADTVVLDDGPRDTADAERKGIGRGERVSNLQGDSGGPIFLGGSILGVASTIGGTDRPGQSLNGNYISAHHHRGWLKTLNATICGISKDCSETPKTAAEVKNPATGPELPNATPTPVPPAQVDYQIFAAVDGDTSPRIQAKAAVDVDSYEMCLGATKDLALACNHVIAGVTTNGVYSAVMAAQTADFFVLIKTKKAASVKSQLVKVTKR